LTQYEYKLYKKIASVNQRLGAYISAHRGLNVQKLSVPFVRNKDEFIFCLEGKLLRKFHLLPIKRVIQSSKINKKIDEFKRTRIIGQLANAHVKNPKPHFKLSFCLAPISSNFISFDTVINISPKEEENTNKLISYLLCYLNSDIFAWYLYRIVYAGAIRSTRLDYEYLKQVPFFPPEKIRNELSIFWLYLSKSLEYLSYGQQYNIKKSNTFFQLQDRLILMMNIAMFSIFLSKKDLDSIIETISLNWQELESFSSYIDNITQLRVESMISAQKSNIDNDFEQNKNKIKYYSQILWDYGFYELNERLKDDQEWNLIYIEKI
jgi:hypothetical protein